MVLKTIDALIREFPIDERRIYAMGQSMGGAGTWNLIASRPKFFAAAVTCCGSISKDDGTASIQTLRQMPVVRVYQMPPLPRCFPRG